MKSPYALTPAQRALLPDDADVAFYETNGYYISKEGVVPESLIDAAHGGAEAFYRGLGAPPKFSPMTIDGTAKLIAASLVGGFPGLNGKADYAHVEMLLLIGSNPVADVRDN